MRYFTKIRVIILLLITVFGMNAACAQEKNVAVKFNTGMSFSKPGDDLGEVADKGKAMQLFASVETSYHQKFSKNTKFIIMQGYYVDDNWNKLTGTSLYLINDPKYNSWQQVKY